MMNRTMEDKIARREAALMLAEDTSVPKACEEFGISQSRLYVYRERYRRYGREGLFDRPPIPRNKPTQKPHSVERAVIQLALQNPALGCHSLAKMLKRDGHKIHGVTVQRILKSHHLGSQNERVIEVQELARRGRINITYKLIEQVARFNPNFREYYNIGFGPGDLLVADVAIVGDIRLLGRLFVYVVIDSYSGYAWGVVSQERRSEPPAAMMHETVLPQLRGSGIAVRCVQTSDHAVFTSHDPGEHRNDFKHVVRNWAKIEHEIKDRPKNERNGQIEYFLDLAREECFRPLLRQKMAVGAEDFQVALGAFIEKYNERPQMQFPLFGRDPLHTIHDGVE